LYENGTLKSINVAIQDRTSAVLANLGKTAINIARMVAGLPPGAGGGKPIKEACNEKTRVALTQNDVLKGQLKDLRNTLLATPVNDRPKIEAEIAKLEKKQAQYLEQLTSTSIYHQKPEFANDTKWSGALAADSSILQKWLSEEAYANSGDLLLQGL